MSALDEADAALNGLDERAVRLECLRLALTSDENDAISVADRFARFVLRGEVPDA